MTKLAKAETQSLLPDELIEKKIFMIRGEKVMLDRDLAELYGVTTSALNQAVRRNARRFPADFMLPLNRSEIMNLSQSVISSIKHSPNVNAFTENGVSMLSSVLHSDRAIQVNIQIMRTFTRLRKLLASHKEILRKLTEHELRLHELNKNVVKIFEVINAIINPPVTAKKKQIGFIPPDKR